MRDFLIESLYCHRLCREVPWSSGFSDSVMVQKVAGSNSGWALSVNQAVNWVPCSNQGRIKQRKERDGLRHLSFTCCPQGILFFSIP